MDALRTRRIAGAGLDVFENEPLPPRHPLYELDNVILTPHSVGWTEELIHDLNFETCASVRAVYQGRVPASLANPEVVATFGPSGQAQRFLERSAATKPGANAK